MTTRLITRALVLLGAGLLFGCGTGDADPVGKKNSAQTCRNDNDCSGGDVCSTLGTCAQPGAPGTPSGPPAPPPPAPPTPPTPPPPTPPTPPRPGPSPTPAQCNLLSPSCNSGERCYPGSEHAADGQCYTAGGAKLGDSCVEPPVDTPNACGAGLLCIYDDANDPAGKCRAICGAKLPCAKGDSCFKLGLGGGLSTVDWGICAPTPAPPPPPPCTPGAQSSCAAGQKCVLSTQGAPICAAVGSGAAASACASVGDCGAALLCATLVGVSPGKPWFAVGGARGGVCLPTCTPSAPSCGSGEICAPLMIGSSGTPSSALGICAAPAP